MNKKSLIEYIDFTCRYSINITDKIFDWNGLFSFPISSHDEETYFKKVMEFFANNIVVNSYNEAMRTTCSVSDFIYKYKWLFDKFLNKEEENISIGSIRFFDTYFIVFDKLITREYLEKDYAKLYNLLIANQ